MHQECKCSLVFLPLALELDGLAPLGQVLHVLVASQAAAHWYLQLQRLVSSGSPGPTQSMYVTALTWRLSMSALRYSGRHSHWRSLLRPKGVVQWSSAASRVPDAPPAVVVEGCHGGISAKHGQYPQTFFSCMTNRLGY
jgi:hypothetical protein